MFVLWSSPKQAPLKYRCPIMKSKWINTWRTLLQNVGFLCAYPSDGTMASYMTFMDNLNSLVFHFFLVFFVWLITLKRHMSYVSHVLHKMFYKSWHVGYVPFNECAIKNLTSYKSGCSQDLANILLSTCISTSNRPLASTPYPIVQLRHVQRVVTNISY